MEHIINFFNNLSKISKAVLLAIALAVPVIDKISQLKYTRLFMPNFTKYVRESENLMPSLWMLSIFLMLYLAICTVISIKDYLCKIYSNKQQQKHIHNTQKHLVEQQTKILLNMTNSAKNLLCNTFEQHPKGDTIMYKHDDPIKHVIAELAEYKVVNRKTLKPSAFQRAGTSHFWVDPEIYDLLSDNNHAIFRQIKDSIPH